MDVIDAFDITINGISKSNVADKPTYLLKNHANNSYW